MPTPRLLRNPLAFHRGVTSPEKIGIGNCGEARDVTLAELIIRDVILTYAIHGLRCLYCAAPKTMRETCATLVPLARNAGG